MTDLLSNQYVSMGIGLALSVISMNPMFGLSQFQMSLLVTTAYKGAVTAITGGDMQTVLQAVAMNMFSTFTWGATGSGLEAAGWKSGTGHWFGRGVVHGVVGGGLSEVQGGDFQDGFLAAATSEMVGEYFGPLTKDNYTTADIGKRTPAAAIIGGTAAAITGGDFVNGAQTAAYAQLYNGFLHWMKEHAADLAQIGVGTLEEGGGVFGDAEGVGEVLQTDGTKRIVAGTTELLGKEGVEAIEGFARELSAEDLGLKGVVDEIKGTLSLEEDNLVARIKMIRGQIGNPFEIVNNLENLARSYGASNIRIEATLANERLYNVLLSRYGLISEGGSDIINLPLK